jgi:hypothetical protein
MKRILYDILNTFENVLETGWQNLLEATRTKPHQKTVWDGIIPTRKTPRVR